jgi:outer membrane protein assembly factor BamB
VDNLFSEVIAMRRTCFVCYGAKGKKNSLTYHEISRKSEGDEFFLFLSWSKPEDELPLRNLYRKIVSSSRLGHPIRFYRELAESSAVSGGSRFGDNWLEESSILSVWKKGEEVFLFRNKRIETVHFDQSTGSEGTMSTLEGRIEIGLQRDGSQTDLFRKMYGDRFSLDQFRISAGAHTILFAPSRDFVRRNREALLDSVLFPSFDVPLDGELELDTDLSLGAMHWDGTGAASATPVKKKRSVEIMKNSVPMAVGAVTLILAILLIFKPFGGRDEGKEGVEETLLSPAATTESGEQEGITDEASEDPAVEVPATSSNVEDALAGRGLIIKEGWKKKFDAAVTSSPVICGDDLTFGCRDGNLYCFKLDGSIKWKYEAVKGVGATPACAGNRIIGADYEGNVFCLDSGNGSLIWNYKSGAKIVSSPVIRDKRVIVCTMDGRIISLGLDAGKRDWSQKIGEKIWATPHVGNDYIVVATTDGSLIRMDFNGQIVWRVAPGGELNSSPLCIEGSDLVVLGTGDKYLIGYYLSSGMLKWRYGAGSEVRSSPSVSGGTIVAGTEEGILIALDADGQLKWKSNLGGAIRSKPLIIGDVIAVTAYNAKLSIISISDGSVATEYRADAPIYSSPAYHGGRVFFGTNGGFLHAPEITTSGG